MRGVRFAGNNLRRLVSPWLVSLIIHAATLLVLGLVVMSQPAGFSEGGFLVATSLPLSEPAPLAVAEPVAPVDHSEASHPQVVMERIESQVKIPFLPALPGRGEDGSLDLAGAGPLPQVSERGGFEGRAADRRLRLALEGGGSQASEDAVERGLRWLMAHQFADGGWRFDLRRSPQCQGQCRNHGSIGSSTAATSLALWPYLGAGYTHIDGEYQEVVRRGLYYLSSRIHATPQGGDLQEGTMYAQGLATLVLCEAYAMTNDESLQPLAQSAIDFIVHAQHHHGGWRYVPGQPGDTTVTGWQILALKSGHLAGLNIPPKTWYAAARFLDRVQSADGAYYGYQTPEQRPTTTSIGLLCRMFLGWPRNHEPLSRGVAYLSNRGPSKNDMYFNYYATLVLHHYGGPSWPIWNDPMRDFLVATQAKEGHETGSWQFLEPHSKEAGRLYNTAMAIMTLEVYYRYMPLYRGEG